MGRDVAWLTIPDWAPKDLQRRVLSVRGRLVAHTPSQFCEVRADTVDLFFRVARISVYAGHGIPEAVADMFQFRE